MRLSIDCRERAGLLCRNAPSELDLLKLSIEQCFQDERYAPIHGP
jgi:hypothetical protein